jgi:stage II sporulation protein AA (anti-sigma F factor antagonist)
MAREWDKGIFISELADEPALSEEISALIDRLRGTKKTPHIVLNFAQVTYINSSNLAQLLRLRKMLAEQGKTMKICSLSDQVWSVFLVTGLDKVFRFAPDPMTALAGIQLEEEGAGS